MKILTVLGARPQFIKAGSISREIAKHQGIHEVIVHTGQHYDTNMSDVFFEEMKIPKPDYFLGIGGKSHGAMTGQMIERLETILMEEKPDWVLVYGDTNSTLAGALAASKLHIKVAHVEAGLRSFNMRMPEEVNRILTDRVSAILFCPSQTAVANLKNEGVDLWQAQVVLSGDVMLDSAMFYRGLSQRPVTLSLSDEFILCTIHRAENTDVPERLYNIVSALNKIAEDKQVILPLHPRTRKILERDGVSLNNLTVIEPVGYLGMVWLIDHCALVVTDSGGLQKEAFFYKKFCVTLRDETEWVELVDIGANVLVGANKENIINEVYASSSRSIAGNGELYGDGNAAEIIIKELCKS